MSAPLLRSNQDVNDARARVFRALGDPTRLEVFQVLAEASEPMCVTAICGRVDCEANLVSHHLGCLKDCQLVDAEREGRKKFYEVSRPEAIEMVALADECIRQNVASVLGCSVLREEQ